MRYNEVESLELLMVSLSHFEREAAFHEHLAHIRNRAEDEAAYRSFREVFTALKHLAAQERWRENPESLARVLDVADRFKQRWEREGRI